MARRCTVCTRPEREAIDAALLAGELSNRRIAAQYGVAETSLRRHKAHLPALLAKAQEARQVARGDVLLAQIRDLQAKTLSILAQAEAAGDLRTSLQAIGEARRNLELLARLLGELQEGSVNILVHPEWVKIRTVIVTALAPYPEAKRGVAEALQHVGA